MKLRRPLNLLTVAACATALLLTSCASNSNQAKKKKRTVLMTEYHDTRAGKEASAGVAAQLGILDNSALATYVSNLGHKLLRGVPRRGFNYKFAIVDQEEANAFALPGGYIFISRGLLALANNEDELACVIGHEIVHAARRHAATQQALAKRSYAMGYLRAAQMASYGRDMERDADKGGQILCAAAGYNPMAMSTFLRSLGASERIKRGYTRGPSFFDSHPSSAERVAVNAIRAQEMRWRRDPMRGDSRASLLAKTDGLTIGQRPEGGVFQGSFFIHPDLNFKVHFPAGWKLQNSNLAVGALSKKGDAAIFLKADLPLGDPEEMAETWLVKAQEKANVKVNEARAVKIGHLDAWRLGFTTSGGFGRSVTGLVTFLPYGEATWSITGLAPSGAAETYRGRTLNTTRSFTPLTEEERHSTSETNLRYTKAFPGETIQRLSERTGNAWNVSDTAIYNAIFGDHIFEGGELVKITKVERYTPKTLSR